MTTLVAADSRAEVGLGLFRAPLQCGLAWGHDGSLVGYETRVRASRDGRHIVVVVANAWGPRSLLGGIDAVAEYAYCNS